MAKITGSGQRVLAELSQDPVARKNKYDTLKRQFDALERRADYLATRLEANQTRSNQGAYNAIVQQLQDTESRINSLATEMNSIAEASRYRAQEDRKQQKIPVSKPKTVMDSVRESLPYQIASSIPQMAVDAYKGVDKTIQYGVNQAMTGKAGTQGSVMNPEDFYMGDVADTYIKELGKNTGTYLDALNSLGYWGATGRLGSKPDSQDGRFRNMIGDAVPRVFGTKDIVDPTVAKGAELVADPLALVPVAGRVKAGIDAVTDPKLWQGIADEMVAGTRSNMVDPKALRIAQMNASKPVSEGGLGLRLDNTPEERAMAMGGQDMYHATDKKDFSEFIPSDKGKLGAGVYVSPKPEYTEKYVGNWSPPRSYVQNARIMPLKTFGKYANREQHSIASELARQSLSGTGAPVSVSDWKAKTQEILRTQGFSGIDMGDERLVFDPKDIRSRFAMFDPMNRDSKNIMAGVALPVIAVPKDERLTKDKKAKK